MLEREAIRLAPFAVIICDQDRMVQFANPRADELFGRDFEGDYSLVGRPFKTLVNDISPCSSKGPDLSHVLPAQGKRPSLDVRCEQLDIDGANWTIFYLTEPEKLHERERLLEKEATTDELSGLANRRAFQRTMEGNQHKALSLAFLDVDHFKSINDVHGHLKGDDVIRHVGSLMTDFFDRSSILVSRMGGDEFSVLFETREEDSIVKLLDEFRAKVSTSQIPDSADVKVSLSIGAVISKNPEVGSRKLLTEADRQLYEAKARGRNLVSHVLLESDKANDNKAK